MVSLSNILKGRNDKINLQSQNGWAYFGKPHRTEAVTYADM